MIGNLPKDKSIPIHVHGAGISGLCVGYYLKKSGRNFLIYEPNDIGGLIQTKKGKHCFIEPAAHTVFTNDDIIEMLEDLDLSYIKSKEKLKKFIYRNNKFSKPLTFREMILTIPGLFKKTPTDAVTIKDFLRPIFSEEIIDDVISSALTGIYSIGADRLHFYSVFKKEPHGESYFSFLKGLKKKSKHKRESISFDKGISTLTNKLAEYLRDHIKKDRCSISEEGHHIICTSAFDAADIIKPLNNKLSDLLHSIPYLKLGATTFVTKNRSLDLKDSFGVLIPAKKKMKVKGIVSSSEVFPALHHNGYNSYKVIHDVAEQDDIRAEFNSLVGYLDIQEEFNTNWEKSIPAYTLERFDIVNKIKEEPLENITLFGNYIQGISIRDIVSSAKELAK